MIILQILMSAVTTLYMDVIRSVQTYIVWKEDTPVHVTMVIVSWKTTGHVQVSLILIR